MRPHKEQKRKKRTVKFNSLGNENDHEIRFYSQITTYRILLYFESYRNVSIYASSCVLRENVLRFLILLCSCVFVRCPAPTCSVYILIQFSRNDFMLYVFSFPIFFSCRKRDILIRRLFSLYFTCLFF